MPPPAAGPSPGWYWDGHGGYRWWDGYRWTAYTQPVVAGPPPGPAGRGQGSTTTAVLVHLGPFLMFVGLFPAVFLVPLVVFLTTPKHDGFTRHHAAEALNYAVTLTIAGLAWLIVPPLVALVLDLPALFALWLVGSLVLFFGSLVLPVVAAIAAARGERYVYPIAIRLVRA